MEPPRSATGIKPEIQGLRAIAVLAVLVFHIWPALLPGGYVGVDIFFVISGYLITGKLLREAERTGSISLRSFYKGRIRRLLPAATLVIIVSSLFFLLLPQVRWLDVAWDSIASAIYLQNWWLGLKAVDYLAEGNAPSLLQHYWSLSVEEQYYIIWPLIGWALMLRSAANRSNPRPLYFAVTAVLGGVSLIYSIYLTQTNPALAYLASTTRVWELAIGGLLATANPALWRLSDGIRATLGWLGLGLIAAACLAFGPATPFPGYMALLPTLGTAMVILAAHPSKPWASYYLLARRPMQFLGDISYSLYLWHWPIVVIYSAIAGSSSISWRPGLAILGLSIGLASLSKRWVEDPFRRSAPIWRGWRPSSLVLLGMSICLVLAMAVLIVFPNRHWLGSSSSKPVDPALLAQAYDPSHPTVPSVQTARNDNPDVYRLHCHVNQVDSDPTACQFGSGWAKHVVAIVGDSHAAQWVPALQEIYGNKPDWRIVSFTKSACAFNAQDVVIGADRHPYSSCSEWNQRVLAKLADLRPEIVFLTASATYRVAGIDDRDENLKALSDGLLQR